MRQDVAIPGCQQTGSRPPSKDEQGIRDASYGEGWAGRARVYFRELYLRVDFNLKFSPIFTCFVGREKVGRSSHRFLETCPRGSPDFSVL
jgi:hypothetical protein